MKPNRLTKLIVLAVPLVALSTAGCRGKEERPNIAKPPAHESTATTAKTEPASIAQVAASPGADLTPVSWLDIKDLPYDLRGEFASGVQRMNSIADVQVKELAAKRAAMPSTVDTKAWDFAMKEANDARTSLKSVASEAEKSTPETWSQAKEKVGVAWERMQDAYKNVLASTTL